MLVAVGLLSFLAALFLLWLARQQRLGTGLPSGRVIYVDRSEWKSVETPLYDPALRLTGKPDYLVERQDEIIPVEVKSGRTPDSPHESHLYQLAAYCYLVEKEFGRRPPYGVLHYPERSFSVDYSEGLEAALKEVLHEMRLANLELEVERSHSEGRRCRGCGYWSQCDQRI